MFRDRWEAFDIASAAIVLAVPLFALVHPRLTLSRNLAFSGLVLAATYVLLPRIVFGSAYADMRLVPFAAAIFVLAVRFKAETRFPLATWLAVAAVGFMLVRLAGTTASMAIAWPTARPSSSRRSTISNAVRGSRCWCGTGASDGRSAAPTISARSPPCARKPTPTIIGRWPDRR